MQLVDRSVPKISRWAAALAAVGALCGVSAPASGASELDASATQEGRVAYESQAATAAPTLDVLGRGYGHGRGMGQWGALGYATAWNIPFRPILDRYYGGTLAGWRDDRFWNVRIRLTKFDDTHFVATADAGNLVTNVTGGLQMRTLLVIPDARGYTLWAGSDCQGSGGWWFVGSTAGPVKFWVNGADPAAQDRSQWFGMCGADNSLRYYRGWGETARTPVGTRLVNEVPVEQYLRGVVPREMPAWWGDRDGGRGAQALAVQAIAARSYALTENRAPGYWHTCDTAACQVYGGAATWSPGAGGALLEDPRTDAAVANTWGEVRVYPDASNTIARTEYSSSTGGYTAGGSFPAVEDGGDALPDNPNFRWAWKAGAAPLQREYPHIGTVTSIHVPARNGLGEWGGRAYTVTVTGTNGSVNVDGETFGWLLGLGTDWFEVTNIRS